MKAEAFAQRAAFGEALCDAMNGTPLNFPGGEVTPPVPPREAMIKSAEQWTTAARERALEMVFLVAPHAVEAKDLTYVIGCLGHVERILRELQP